MLGRIRVAVPLLCAACLVVVTAAYGEKLVDSFFPPDGTPGAQGGIFNTPRDLVVNDPATPDAHDGWVYVVDEANNRVQAFERDGGTGEHEFRWAIGRDVIAPTATTDTDLGDTFEKCTAPSDCQSGSAGSEADGPGGELNLAKGIALDQQTGHIFVREIQPNLRVQEFTADGDFVRAFGWNVISASATTDADLGDVFEVCTTPADCQAGGTSGDGGQAGQFAVDPGGEPRDNHIGVVPQGAPNAGNVIAHDSGNRRVMEFDPDAATTAGVFVRAWGWGLDSGANRFEICTAATTCAPAVSPSGGSFPNGSFTFPSFAVQLAVDSRGVTYVHDRPGSGGPRVMRFDTAIAGDDDVGPTSAAVQMLLPVALQSPAGNAQPILEVDPDSDGAGTADFDRLYAGLGSVGIREYDVSSKTDAPVLVETHMASSGLTQNAIAVNSVADLLYVTSTDNGHRVYVLDEGGNTTPPDVTIDPVEPSSITTESAELDGTLNPNGFPASYVFQYREVGAAAWTDVGASQPAGDGTADIPISASLTGLAANTQYEARVFVTRAFGNGTLASNVVQFTTEALGPSVTTNPPNHRGCSSATLAGRINPNGSATEYVFEYGPTDAYGSQVPQPIGQLAAGGSAVEVSERVVGLQPGTTYHYRLIAESAEGPGTGDDQTFTTRANCVAAPPGRGYELVSPAREVGGIGVGQWLPGDLGAAAPGTPSRSGERYVSATRFGPVLLEGAFAYASDWAFADRTATGWVSHSPFTRPNYGYAGNRFATIDATNDDLSRFSWTTNGGRILFFPDMEEWDEDIQPLQIGDWQGRYEVLAPTAESQGSPILSANRLTHWSRDGRLVAATVSPRDQFTGLGGGDPNAGRLAGARAVYVHEAPAGLSDSFPGQGARTPVGVCDAGTTIPARVENSPADFEQGTQPCPAGSLVSPGGASLIGFGSDRNIVSADGSRVFFQSPDPAIDPAACSGTGAASSCPTQVFVRERAGAGAATRWISRSEVADQDASLMAPAYFEGASADGDKVFFRSLSPLTTDDPNGACGAPCTSGSPNPESWDLFMYDFTDPPSDDPGAGDLIRVSAGPTGTADSNVQVHEESVSLRFVADGGERAYFTAAAPLPGVSDPPAGGSTVPGGSTSIGTAVNLYLYDLTRPSNDRYRFVARLPRSTEDDALARCASMASSAGNPIGLTAAREGIAVAPGNCVSGLPNGELVTFITDGGLVSGDAGAPTGDVYAYDAEQHELNRVSAPQGGIAASYPCVTHTTTSVPLSPPLRCWGDGGIGQTELPRLSAVADPSGEHSVYFQSKSRLLPDDSDDAYDVYEWRGGELTLLTPGTSTGAYYTGSSSDGQDVFFMTRDALTWQDDDATMDVYDVRRGGGFPEPPPPEPGCEQSAPIGCQGPGAGPAPMYDETDGPGAGNAVAPSRVKLSLRALSRDERRRASRRGVLVLRMRSSGPARVAVTARARIRGRLQVVGRASARLRRAGVRVVKVRLSRQARRRLRSGKALRVTVEAVAGSRSQSMTVRLKRGTR